MDQEFEDELKYLELREMVEKADNTVALAVVATAITGAIPIPFADMPVLIGEQVTMMATICGVFHINIKKDGLKALVAAAIGAGGAGVVGKTIATNLLKLVPGPGTVAGGVVSAGTAGVITLAIGKAFIEVCKANKMGKLSEDEILSTKGINMMKQSFRKNLKKK
jgi:uncharacterized protein (DUF697 family)